MLYVVYYRLQETRPCLWFLLAFLLFAGSQVVLFLASQPLCEVRGWVLSAYVVHDFVLTHLNPLAGLEWQIDLGIPVDPARNGGSGDAFRCVER